MAFNAFAGAVTSWVLRPTMEDRPAFDACEIFCDPLRAIDFPLLKRCKKSFLFVGVKLLPATLSAVLATGEQFQVVDGVVEFVIVPVVDIKPFLNRSVGSFPNLPVQTNHPHVVAVLLDMPSFPTPLDTPITHTLWPRDICWIGVHPDSFTQTRCSPVPIISRPSIVRNDITPADC